MNFQNIMTLMNQIRNPQQLLQRMGVPQEHLNSPQDAAQFLMQNGKVTQEQIDQANQMYSQFFRR